MGILSFLSDGPVGDVFGILDPFKHDPVTHSLGLRDNPADKAKLKAMRQAQLAYEQYRPELMQARLNAMNQAFSLFGPSNNMLGQMYGPDAMANFSLIGGNPFPGQQPAPAPSPDLPPPRAKPKPQPTESATGMLSLLGGR